MKRSMIRLLGRFLAVFVPVVTLCAVSLSEAEGAPANSAKAVAGVYRGVGVGPMHKKTGVGSCTLKGWDPIDDPADAASTPFTSGVRHQSYKPDNYDCKGAVFAKPGVEFRRFPQPQNFRFTDRRAYAKARSCVQHAFCSATTARVLRPVARTAAAINPLAPYFPPFQHFVIIYRENHTFDDYLGDCATTVKAGCKGVVQSTNHISSVPGLHTLAKTYALGDSYSTGTQPPSGPNHWWLFSGQSSSSSQQQSWPSTGTMFDRFLSGINNIPGQGTSSCSSQPSDSSSSTNPFTFMMAGDFYWMLNSGSGYWKNPKTGSLEVLPVDRPGTTIPEELHYNEYTCSNVSISDTTVANDYLSFVSANGLPAFNYVELFNDHPGSNQDIPTNDAETKAIVDSIMGNASYKNNTLIIVTEDDTQNGNNGPDHVSNTYRVPLVVIGSPTYVKANYVSHVAYTTSNVIAAMERVMQNVHSGIIDPNDNLGLSTFPMTSADQSALGDPLEDFWVQGAVPLSASAAAAPTTGNAPLTVNFAGSATGGTAPYSYSWNFGDGSSASTSQNPSHTYSAAGTYTATLTVTDSESPAKTATSSVTLTINSVGGALTASASGSPTSGQIPVTTNFTGTATGGTPPYSYSWNFGDTGSSSNTSRLQNPSHTYNSTGTFTATLTVTDSASPAHTASATVSVTADPIASTPPGAPTGLTATAGNGQASLQWTAPANTGGQQITAYTVYRATTSGGETKLTSGGCSGLGNVVTCTDTGLTNGTKYYYEVTASNPTGEGAKSAEASATPTATGCSAAQLFVNPGFESGSSHPAWTVSSTGSPQSAVINGPNSSAEPPRTGAWNVWLDGWGSTHTDTLAQTVTIPSTCTKATLSFWLHIDTAETTTTTKYDTLQVQVLEGSTVESTALSYSNLNHATGYQQRTADLSAYAGKTVTVKWIGKEDYEKQTSFVIDDTALNVS
jgi:PKD repeat protein